MFLLVPAHTGSPGQRAVKQLLLLCAVRLHMEAAEMVQTVQSLRGQHCFTKGKLPRYGHYTGQPALDGTRSQELEDFVEAKFYCKHAVADGN